jgi:hypothetical protein
MERCEGKCREKASAILWEMDAEVRFCPRCRHYWVVGDDRTFCEVEMEHATLADQLRTRAVLVARKEHQQQVRYQDCKPGSFKA